jgi:multidrug efflux pump
MEQDNLQKQELPHGSGFIYKLIGWLAANKTTVYLFTIMLTVAGFLIYNALPKEQFPEIKIPQIIVQTVYAGTAPGDIENTINKPIEKQLKSQKGVKRIKSNALQDVSIILVEFNTDVEVEDAKERVKTAVETARKDLPKDLTQDPNVAEINFSEFPIMNINLSGNYSLKTIKNYAEQIQDAIETLPEITRVDIVGALKREIQINLDLYKMQTYGLTFYDIQSAIQGENVNISGGELNVDDVRRTLKVQGEFKSVEQIQNIIIASGQGAKVRLGDVADVKDTYEEQQDFARLNNKSVITLNVIKRGGENLVSASDRIFEILDEFKAKLPEGMNVTVTADSSERTKADLDDLLNTVVLGFIFVVLVLMFFMGVRDAIFVGLSVPLSALMAFMPILGMGFTLNTIVLFGFLLGLGLVVDDAIVVIENAHRLFNKHRNLSITEAVKLAASEVFVPVLSGTLTTIMPFTPLLVWGGIFGEFMKYLPWTLIFTLAASLIVAYVMNPVFAISFMKRHEEEHEGKPTFREILKPMAWMAGLALIGYFIHRGAGNFMVFLMILYVFNHFILTPYLINPFQNRLLPAFKNGYRKVIAWVIQGWRPIGVVFGAFLLLVFTFILVGIKQPQVILFPSGDPDYVYVYNVMPIGTDARVTDATTREIEKRVFDAIKKNGAEKAVNSVISNVGLNAGDPFNPDRAATPHKSKVTVAFVKKTDRDGISSEKMLEEIRKAMKGIPGSEISVERENNGPPAGKAVTIEVMGDDFNTLIGLEKQVRAGIQRAGIEGIDQLKSDLVTNKPEIIINVDREKASREGISSAQVAMAIRTALFGSEISKFRDDKDEYPIMLRLNSNDRASIEKLLSMNVTYRDMTMGGVLRNVPLSSIASISYSTTYSQINRKDLSRMITLSSDVTIGFNPNEVNQKIQDVVDEIALPSGYKIKLGGEQEEFIAAFSFLGNAFLVALLFIFVILAAQFNSLSKPIIVFVTILFSLIGVMLGFILTGKNFSVIMSGVGIIALAGIVVKNGILLIEFTDELRSRGYKLKEAIVEGGATRLTPVLLTASAAVLGLIPLAFGLTVDFGAVFADLKLAIHTGGDSAVFWNILAWTIIYGLTFSTVLTLVIVPCMYYIIESLKLRFKKKKPEVDLSVVEEIGV